MAKQLHKKFSNHQVKFLLERYVNKEIKIDYILDTLSIKRSRFFELLNEYRKNPDNFSVTYKRGRSTRRVSKEIDENIIKELRIEKSLIENKNISI